MTEAERKEGNMSSFSPVRGLKKGSVVRVEIVMPDGVYSVLFRIANEPGDGYIRLAVVHSPREFFQKMEEWRKLTFHLNWRGRQDCVSLPVVSRNGGRLEVTFDMTGQEEKTFSLNGEAELFQTSGVMDE